MITFTTHPQPQTGITSFCFELFGRPWSLTVTRGMVISGWERVVGSRISPTDRDHDAAWPHYRMSCWPNKVLTVDDAVGIIRREYQLAGGAA